MPDSPPDIVHVLPAGYPLGGTERAVLDLLFAPELASYDQRVAFALPGPAPEFPADRVLTPARVPFPAPLRSAVAIARARPRIIHSWLLVGNAVGAVAKTLWSGSTLITSERNLGHTLTPAKQLLERYVSFREDIATMNAQAVRDAAVRRIPRRSERARVITSGVQAPRRPASVRPATCVVVGRLHWVKAPSTALRVWANLIRTRPDAILTLIGEGPERGALERLSEQLGIRCNIRFAGDCDPIPHLFGAKVYLSTAVSEGMSRAMLEALAAGLPVVASDVGGARELPAPAVRRVPVGDVAAFSDGIDHLLSDPDAYLAASTAARDVIRQRHSFERWVGEYAALYGGVVTH